MQCTPESNIYHWICKDQNYYRNCSDSKHSGLFYSPKSVTSKERTRKPVKFLSKDYWETQRAAAVSWCETPKRDSLLRQMLLMCRTITAVKSHESHVSPSTRKNPISVKSENWLRASLDSLDSVADLASSTLKLDQDVQFSAWKRRLLFTQVRTSTLLDDGKLNSGLPALSKENSQSPVSGMTKNLYDSSSVVSTPASTHSPKHVRSLHEDSGFGSLTLDKSQDSSVDHDGSFQELLLSFSRGNRKTPKLADAKRRPRLQRQHRLSTLKEGGSQSEEGPAYGKHDHLHQCHGQSKEDEVFVDGATPHRGLSLKCANSVSSDDSASKKPDHATPLRVSAANPDTTPLRTTLVNLSLTPAMQLVHAMCQQKAQMFVGQSPSLKEHLKSTAALTKMPEAFRTTMPLAGLIGRKMGLGKVNVLTELKKRNLGHILTVILVYLTPESIFSCGQVCKSWNEIIKQDKRASLKRRCHLSEVEASLELGASGLVPDAENRLSLLKRSALKTVQAQSRSSSFCSPLSGTSTLTPLQNSSSSSSSSKQEKFLEVAKTLFIDECLKPCPRCQHPARCHSVKREGACSRDDCGFRFCTACLCAFHGSRECGSQFLGRRKKDTLLPGSTQSKRNIRRL